MINFDFTQNLVLEDEVALLRPLEISDTGHLTGYSLNEPELWKYSFIQPTGEEAMSRYIQKTIDARKNETEFPFIVYDKRAEKYAGSTRFYDIKLQNQSLQLGYTWYGKQFHGSGLNKHCKFLLLGFAFDRMGIERVEFRADVRNEKSIAAMKSVGCTVEGILRSEVPMPAGGRRDSIVLSILKTEWDDRLRNELKNKL